MKRYPYYEKERCANNRKGCDLHIKTTKLRQKNTLEIFYRVEHDDGSVSFVDDVYMLFNQQRLDKMTLDTLSQYLEQLSRQSNPLRDLRSRVPDKYIMNFIKSRYIQHPSELEAWSNYLDATYAKEMEKLNAVIDEHDVAKHPDLLDSPSPAPVPTESA